MEVATSNKTKELVNRFNTLFQTFKINLDCEITDQYDGKGKGSVEIYKLNFIADGEKILSFLNKKEDGKTFKYHHNGKKTFELQANEKLIFNILTQLENIMIRFSNSQNNKVDGIEREGKKYFVEGYCFSKISFGWKIEANE
ncbi:MAG: hypothetical protein MUF50_02935 [Planctomycetes bacterium]|jgi:hypothetical protein|nr:hypothetical protein [Planctomycetota bacterium]